LLAGKETKPPATVETVLIHPDMEIIMDTINDVIPHLKLTGRLPESLLAKHIDGLTAPIS
jgi:hypothetical protein